MTDELQEVTFERESKTLHGLTRAVGMSLVGKDQVIESLVAGAVAGGHILMEDYPGLGKTLLVKTFAKSVGCEFKRIQFTPDILPSDILGTKVWDQSAKDFVLKKGPIFTNVLLADEINRAPPKTQSALLEAMEERQVTIDGETLPLPRPFFVLATQNPIEQEGTYPLPEAQMDRFLLRLHMGYPQSDDEEAEILARRTRWQQDDPTKLLKAVMDAPKFQALQDAVERNVRVSPAVQLYAARIVRGVRDHPRVRVGPSPRGTLALYKMGKALALMRGRDFVVPDDIKGVAVDALAHRTILKVEHLLSGDAPTDVVREAMQGVPVPKLEGRR